MELLWLLVVILIIGWLLGFWLLPSVGYLIHILLVIAIILIIVRLISGRRLF